MVKGCGEEAEAVGSRTLLPGVQELDLDLGLFVNMTIDGAASQYRSKGEE